MFFTNLKFWSKYYLNIDSMGKGIASKLLFLTILILKLIPNFLPPAYTDFSALQDWFTTILYAEEVTEDMMVITLTRENYLFLLISSAVLYTCYMLSVLYSGLVVRHFRKLKGETYLSNGRLFGRFIVVCLVIAFLALPLAFFAVYLVLLFLLSIPFLATIIPCYLSGDEGLFGSIAGMFKRTKGRYLLMLRDITGLYVVYLVVSLVSMLISLLSDTAYIVVTAAIESWFLLVAARFCAIQYTMTKKT